ncbi:tRNA (adenine(58)-N(1))-methyltransferase non-catalytic subunit TRM6, partial [Blyttiomyces sp. JEL0837]
FDADEDANNSGILDSADSQKLSQCEIEALKKQSLEGNLQSNTLIKQIVDNSATFDEKTAFAKLKYIKKKKTKFSKTFQALRPSIRNYYEFFFAAKPQKLRNMRLDTLSQMLCMGNVHAGQRLLVVDSSSGLLIGAILERTQGIGSIVALCDGDMPHFETLKQMNFPPEVIQSVTFLSWNRLEASPHEEIDRHKQKSEEVYTRKMKRVEEIRAARAVLEEGNFDGLLISSQHSVLEVINKLQRFVGGSRPIIVYSTHREFLVPTYLMMRSSATFINAQLTESWMREYQTPSSSTGTHPFMQTSGTGGYLLSCIRGIADKTKDGETSKTSTRVKKLKKDNAEEQVNGN